MTDALKSLTPGELGSVLQRALEALPQLKLAKGVDQVLAGYADGDARKLLNLLELLDTAVRVAGVSEIDTAFIENALAQSLHRFDKGGEVFYDQISALHKSVRDSSPDAALYWLVRMLDGGADPRYLGRRLIRMASEDIGLADPRALSMTARRRGNLRAPGHARRRTGAGASLYLSGVRAQKQCGLCGVQRRARLCKKARPMRCHCICAMPRPN